MPPREQPVQQGGPRLTLRDVIKLLVAPVAAGPVRKVAGATPWLSMREAMPVAGALYAHGDITRDRLAAVSDPLLADLDVSSSETRRRALAAIRAGLDAPEWAAKFRGTAPKERSLAGPAPAPHARSSRTASSSEGPEKLARPGPRQTDSPRKRQRHMDPAEVARDWGDSQAAQPREADRSAGQYVFNEVLDEEALHGRSVVVNRAPVLTAWATVVLEKLGFERDEALSLAHCYVSNTSTARGLSIGAIPRHGPGSREAPPTVGSNQPHFELMRVRIPVMQMDHGGVDGPPSRYRGISQGAMVSPDAAFNYMRR